ncbi:HupE/UreJ family protein [Mangrovimicrobium sediminis]|uniref:HupE/UreJ family protein n=1 Tax=Mangrovimicrobium sediminis TaxID=2562682 RepID=UPI00197F8CF8|nr:HupE/UreJ family protein [Haliea sp. SAOS-164]
MRPILALLLLCAVCGARADELRPAYLQLTETRPDVFEVLFKVPARGGAERLDLRVEFDDSVVAQSAISDGFVGGAHLQRWTLQRPGGLAGTQLGMTGPAALRTETLLRVQYRDGSALVHRLTPEAPRYVVEPQPGLWQVVSTYLVLGVEHILIGLDHLLFVLVLLLMVDGTRKLVATITAFTVAHSITLSLAALDLVRVPVPPVEACIALSIVFVAAEIVHRERGLPSLTARRPWIVAFTFGLLHGLGFAAALGEIGLPQSAVPAALLFFNVGVEIGQLLFVAAVLLFGWVARQALRSEPPRWREVPAYAVGALAMFWVIERTAGFWA